MPYRTTLTAGPVHEDEGRYHVEPGLPGGLPASEAAWIIALSALVLCGLAWATAWAAGRLDPPAPVQLPRATVTVTVEAVPPLHFGGTNRAAMAQAVPEVIR